MILPKMNDIDRLCILNIIIAICMILLGLMADRIFAALQLGYSPGIGAVQIVWVLGWGAYIAWNVVYINNWGL